MLRPMLCALLGMAVVACGGAQQPAPTQDASSQDSLLIGPGDALHIKVLEAPDLEQRLRVADNGDVKLVLGGTVNLAGMSVTDAEQKVDAALMKGDYILHPHSSIAIERSATENVSVVGQVRTPGAFPISTPRSVLDIIAMAGGLTETAARKITIQRHSDKQKVEYLMSNASSTALDSNVQVFPGDTIIVPKADVIYVLGDVRRPGGIAISTNDSRLTVLQAVSLAGGTAPSAVPAHTRLLRKEQDGSYTQREISVSDMQKGKRPDMELTANDVLYVPFSYIRNMGANNGFTAIIAAAATASIYSF